MRGVLLAVRKACGTGGNADGHMARPVAPLQSNGGVAQGIERRIANPWDAGSTPAPATNFIIPGYPVLATPSNRNRQTREGHADYTLAG